MAPKKADAKGKAKAKAEAKAEAKATPKPKASAKAAPAEPEEDYSSWPIAKLQAKLKELGATTSGGKAALVARVKALAPEMGSSAPSAPKAAAKSSAKAKASAPPPEEPPAKKAKTEEPKAKAKAKSAAATPEPKAAVKRDAGGEAKIVGPSKVFFEDGEFSVEYAKSNRSACKTCKEKIDMGKLRFGKVLPSEKFDGKYTAWSHVECFLQAGILPRSQQMINGWSTIRPDDQEEIAVYIPADASGGASGVDNEALKAQNLKVFEIQDALSSLGDVQLKEMMKLNGYPTSRLGSTTATPAQLCADGILFGAVGKCEVCSGDLLLGGEGYRCKGWVNEFLKCTFKTQEPPREVWELTPAAESALKATLGKQKLKTGTRLFASELKDDEGISASQGDQKKPAFMGITVAVLSKGDTMAKAKLVKMIQENGGSVADKATKACEFAVASTAFAEQEDNALVESAISLEIPGVNEEYVNEAIEEGELPVMEERHLLWGQLRKRRKIEEKATTKFIEKRGVAMDADVGEELVKKAHVLVDMAKKCVYSEMLNRTDMTSGANSFYTLQLLESDETPHQYWVFRKWGRIGVSQGGTKLEEHHSNKYGAIHSFEAQYQDKTGNTFGHKKEDFVTKPGTFVRVDVEHKALSKKGAQDDDEAGEGGGGGDQPLGKLSKAQIEKGDGVLNKIEALLNEGDYTKKPPAEKAAAVAQFATMSAQYYTMIPHNFGKSAPPVINNADLLGAEKALLQFYLRMGFEEMGDDKDDKLTPIGGVMELPLPKTLHEAAHMVCGQKDIKSCINKGTPMFKKKAGNPTKVMSPDLYGAILLYTSNAIYQQLNKALRDEDRAVVEKYFPYLRLLFEAVDRMPKKSQTLWRGIGVDLYPQYKVGSTIIWWGVSSCTSDKKVAENFMAGVGDGATFLTIETETACDISEVSFYANEAESILLPGTQLQVMKSEKVGKKSNIWLKEVGRCVS